MSIQVSTQILNVSALNMFIVRNIQKILPNLHFQYKIFL